MGLTQKRQTPRRIAFALPATLLVVTLTAGVVTHTLVPQTASASGTITFSSPTSEPVGAGPSDLVVGDLGNGAQDIVVANDGNNSDPITVFWNNGHGAFTKITPKDTGALASAVAIGDFNGDGKPDLVIGEANNSRVQMLLGNGNSTFFAQSPITIDGHPSALATGDFNGDGRSDIAVVYDDSGTTGVDVLLNTSTGTSKTSLAFTSSQGGPNSDSPQAVAVGDLNGNQGIVTADQNGGVSVFLGKGDGTFQAESTYATTLDPTQNLEAGAVVLAHLNAISTHLDIISSTPANGTATVLYNQGNGTYPGTVSSSDIYQVGGTDENSIYLSATDFNGDGYTDLAVTDGTSNQLQVLPGKLDPTTGNTTFDTAQQVYPFGTYDMPVALGAADFTGDHLPDIATLVSGSSNELDVFENTSPTPVAGPTVNTRITGGETINGITYVTPSSIITFSANDAVSISYRYYLQSLGAPIARVGGSDPAIARVGGNLQAMPQGLGSYYLPYKTTLCTTGTTCSTSTTISGTTSSSTSGITSSIVPTTHVSFEARSVAGTKSTSTRMSDLLTAANSSATYGVYVLNFYATGTNGSGSPATAKTMYVTLVKTLPPTNGRSGAGKTGSPITATGQQSGTTQQNPSSGNTNTTGNPATAQQTAAQSSQAQPTDGSRLTLVFAVLAVLVLFALGSGIALTYSRRRNG